MNSLKRFFSSSTSSSSSSDLRWSLRAFIEAFRDHGHFNAALNPLPIDLERPQKSNVVDSLLKPSYYGLTETTKINSKTSKGLSEIGIEPSLLSNIKTVSALQSTLSSIYCNSIGIDVSHLRCQEEKSWIHSQFEVKELAAKETPISSEERKELANLLLKGNAFDLFMTRKYTNVKRYGLEGAESMLISLSTLFQAALSTTQIRDMVISMPHRGRLNFLVTLLGYEPRHIFHKVSGGRVLPKDARASCDVTSHLATSIDISDSSDPSSSSLHVSLLNNPSHLEATNPVAMGKVRAKQLAVGDIGKGEKAMAIMIHGDGAYSGQGIVPETFVLANLPGYSTGGSFHLIVNNQLGFTASAHEGRSSCYAADIARMIDAPVFHVNADDPEAVARITKLALEYRQKFSKDVVVDLISYRKWGHNELDEPAFTQPLMYAAIRAQTSVAEQYSRMLIDEGVVSEQEKKSVVDEFDRYLTEQNTQIGEKYSSPISDYFSGPNWKGMRQAEGWEMVQHPTTGIDEDSLKSIAIASITVPDGFTPHSTLVKSHIGARTKRIDSNDIDWATAETLAFGSLMKEGFNVRLSGQDCGRGTFSHRHAVLTDSITGDKFIPLNENLPAGSGSLEPVNSPLSEFSVLSYEYGYSLETPSVLPIWEAQFGDFANSAQVAIDTFVSSSETKWLRQTGLVMLLPHAYDGAGPEHSSARLERFLQMTDDLFYPQDGAPYSLLTNWSICNLTTPANYFHALRRQLHRPFRTPLIIAAPKTLLRLPAASSTLQDLSGSTSFQSIIDDPAFSSGADRSSVNRVLLCSGKVYYDLVRERQNHPEVAATTAIVRIEELAPFPHTALDQVMSEYPNAANNYIWVQEESMNAGAWSYIEPRFQRYHGQWIKYVGRSPLAAPAVSESAKHIGEAKKLYSDAFTL